MLMCGVIISFFYTVLADYSALTCTVYIYAKAEARNLRVDWTSEVVAVHLLAHLGGLDVAGSVVIAVE